MVIVTADEISMFEFESGKELKDSTQTLQNYRNTKNVNFVNLTIIHE